MSFNDQDHRESYQHGVSSKRLLPTGLRNKEIGGQYRNCSFITRGIWSSALGLLNSESAVLASIIMTCYFNRCNTIEAKGSRNEAEIKHIFGTYLVDYYIPVFELFKRYSIRVGAFKQAAALQFPWQTLEANGGFLKPFKAHLISYGTFRYTNGTVDNFWCIRLDAANQECVQLCDNPATRLLVQLINSVGDAVCEWPPQFKSAAQRMPPHSHSDFYIS